MDGRPGTLTEVVVGDDPAAWASVGFAVVGDGTCRVGTVRLRLVGAVGERGRGIVRWTLAGIALDGDTLDGLPTTTDADPAGADDRAGDRRHDLDDTRSGGGSGGAPRDGHPNGVVAVDHVVAVTPDLDRTTAAIEAAGVPARRTREAGPGRLQRFFRVGEAILELAGPVEPRGDGPARFWGLAFTVADIDATAELLVGRIGDPKPAVQPGRRIATLRAGDDVSVPVAFMSPDGRARPRGAG